MGEVTKQFEIMQLIAFEYIDETHHDNINTVEIDGEIWFVAKDVCDLLGINNSRQAISSLDDDEKNTVIITDGIRGNPNKTIISESGLFALIFKSKKPEAKKFRKWITHEVIPQIRRTGGYGLRGSHSFVRRFNENYDRIDIGYFSVIGYLFIILYGRFEMAGHIISEKTRKNIELRPDVSVGRLFAKWHAAKYPDVAREYKYYNHKLPDGTEVEARQYSNKILPHFIEYVETVWMPDKAADYFKSRDPLALNYLPVLLEGFGKYKRLA